MKHYLFLSGIGTESKQKRTKIIRIYFIPQIFDICFNSFHFLLFPIKIEFIHLDIVSSPVLLILGTILLPLSNRIIMSIIYLMTWYLKVVPFITVVCRSISLYMV